MGVGKDRGLTAGCGAGFNILLALLLLSNILYSQESTSSPYSRFGLGDLSSQFSPAFNSLGGGGYAFYSDKIINPYSPATYTAFKPNSTPLVSVAPIFWYTSEYPEVYLSKPDPSFQFEQYIVPFPFHILFFKNILFPLLPKYVNNDLSFFLVVICKQDSINKAIIGRLSLYHTRRMDTDLA